jgi:uncharacterized protein YbcI
MIAGMTTSGSVHYSSVLNVSPARVAARTWPGTPAQCSMVVILREATLHEKRQQIETAVQPLVARFEQYYLGRTSGEVRVQLIGDLLLVRSRGALTDAESRLMLSDPTPTGRDAIELLYRRMIRQSQAGLVSAVESLTGVEVRTVHCDLDAVSGESLLAFSLERDPLPS